MSSIPISKERGIDPHMATCMRCGGENGLTVGVLQKAELSNGQMAYCQKGSRAMTLKNIEKAGLDVVSDWEEVTDPNETIPMGICLECEEEIQDFDAELQKGGVYFKCTACKTAGMVTGDTDLAKKVREMSKIPAPDPVGVEFNKCSEHGVTDEQPEITH